jgi:hypothetical protein
MEGKWTSGGREELGVIGRGCCLPCPAAWSVHRSTTSIPLTTHFPHSLPRRSGRGQRLYRRSLPPLLFLSFPTVSVSTSASISIFTLFPLRIYFRPAPLLAGPIESLLRPLHVIVYYRLIWNTISFFNNLSPR